MYLKNAIDGFILARTAEGVSPYTVKIYQWGLCRFMNYFDNHDINQITQNDIRSYFHHLQTTTHLPPESLKMALRTIHAFYSWAEIEINVNRPDKVIRLAPSNAKDIFPYTQDEIKSLIKACEYTATSQV